MRQTHSKDPSVDRADLGLINATGRKSRGLKLVRKLVGIPRISELVGRAVTRRIENDLIRGAVSS